MLEHQRERQPRNDNRLMVMDDDADVGAFFGQVGEDLGFEVKVISDPTHFGATVLEFSPTVLLLDLQMPGRDGIELLRELSSLDVQARRCSSRAGSTAAC